MNDGRAACRSPARVRQMDYRVEQLRYQLREDPTSRQFYQLGELLRREGELEESVAVLRAGLEHHPRYLAAWVALGRALFDLNAYDEAEAAFARALALDPQNAVAAQMVGRAAARRGEWERAVKGLTLALALGPRDDELEAELEEARSHLGPSQTAAPAAPAAEPEWVPEPEAEPETEPETEPEAEPEAEPETEPETEPEAEPAQEPEPPEPAPPPLPGPGPAVRAAEVAELSAEDPFAVEPRGDSGVFFATGDVFLAAEDGPPAPAAREAWDQG
ncbi:MAG: tetratricopeptide repeat protein, partial [Acidobacteria bacterium]|nr:tetratricopeptide repeat protein [Acidobacteriota bacterium]